MAITFRPSTIIIQNAIKDLDLIEKIPLINRLSASVPLDIPDQDKGPVTLIPNQPFKKLFRGIEPRTVLMEFALRAPPVSGPAPPANILPTAIKS